MSEERYIEQSQNYIDRMTQERIANAKSRLPIAGITGTPFCNVCGDEIPRQRTALGYSVCICCAENG